MESQNDSDSLFSSITNNLMSSENIELKTEYIGIEENFHGAKLEFLGEFTNNPMLKHFLNIWERKRVSLERKSRIEIIKALQQRAEEQERLRTEKMRGVLGI
jgi:hypothetical protein